MILSGTVAVSFPDVPLITALYCPRLAVFDAVKVSVLPELLDVGENEPVTPLGRPETERFTLPPDPFCQSIHTELVPVVPGPIVTLESPSVNVGVPTVNTNVVLAVREPEVPLTVTVLDARAAVLDAVRIMLTSPDGAGLGENVAVTPAGRPLAASFTAPVKSNTGLTLTELVTAAPGEMVKLPGPLIENAGA